MAYPQVDDANGIGEIGKDRLPSGIKLPGVQMRDKKERTEHAADAHLAGARVGGGAIVGHGEPSAGALECQGPNLQGKKDPGDLHGHILGAQGVFLEGFFLLGYQL